MSNHTPGPWKTAEGSYGHYVAVKAGKKTIARIPWGDNDGGNAALCAAAPDLLAALDELTRQITVKAEREGGLMADEKYPAVVAARAAIAKAKGTAND